MAKVESFDLDHTKVRAPYVRIAGVKHTPKGDTITKYDLRLTQPNQEAIDSSTLHTLEHLLAGYLRDHLQDVLDVSPMGCRTGMYMAVIAEPAAEQVRVAFEQALKDVASHGETIPGVSELECGNFRDHNLQTAKEVAHKVLEQGLIVQETINIQR